MRGHEEKSTLTVVDFVSLGSRAESQPAPSSSSLQLPSVFFQLYLSWALLVSGCALLWRREKCAKFCFTLNTKYQAEAEMCG